MRKLLSLFFAVLLTFLSATPSLALPPDTDAPVIVEFTPSKTLLDTGSDDRSMSFTVRATDASGIANLAFYCSDILINTSTMWFLLFPGYDSTNINFDSNAAVKVVATVGISGDQNDHTWVVNFSAPYNRPDSSCSQWTYVTADTQGNRGRGNLSPGLEVRQASQPVDSEAAKIDGSSVVVSNSSPSLGDTVNIRFRVTDDTGIGTVAVFLKTPEPNQAYIGSLIARRIAGTSTDAVYSVDVTIPGSPYPTGTWTIELSANDIFNKGGPRWPVLVEVAGETEPDVADDTKAEQEAPELQVQRAGSQLVIHVDKELSGTFEVFEDGQSIATFSLGGSKSSHVVEQRVTGEIRIEKKGSSGNDEVELAPTRSLLWYQNFNLGLVKPSSLDSIQRAAVDGLARSYKRVNGSWIPRGQTTSKFICTGIYGPQASFADKVDARKRAKLACETAQSMNPGSDVSFWFQTKETKALSYVNKVLVTVKGLETFVEEGLN